MKLFDVCPCVTVLLLHRIQIQVREAVLSTLLALRAAIAVVDAASETEASNTPAADVDRQTASPVSFTSFETLANVVLTPPLAPLLARMTGRSACANLVVEVVEHFGKQFGNVSADTSSAASTSASAAAVAVASTNSATAAIGNTTISEGTTSFMSEEGKEGSSVSSSPSSSSKTWVGSAVDSARADALAAESKRRARAAAASAAISEERLALAVRLAPGS